MDLAPSRVLVGGCSSWGLFPFVGCSTLVIGGVADAVAHMGFLGLEERETSGLVRGFPPLYTPASGDSRSWTLAFGGSNRGLLLLRVNGGFFSGRG